MAFKPLSCVYGHGIAERLPSTSCVKYCYNRTGARRYWRCRKSHCENDPCPEHKYVPVPVEGKTYNWDEDKKALVLYSFFIGYVFGHLPGGWLADKLGGRHVMGTSMLLSTVFTILFPVSIEKGSWIGATITRILMGLSQGPLFPAISSFIQNWIPSSERGFLGGLAFGGSNLGTLTGGLLSGIIIHRTNSWSNPFYIWAFTAIVWYAFAMVMIFSRPDTHPFITDEERDYLAANIEVKKKKFKVPWLKLVRSSVIWALFVAQWSHNYIYFTLFLELPKYMKEVLHLSVESNAAFSFMPFFCLWISSIIFAFLADVLTNKGWLSVLNCRRIYTTVGNVVPAVCIMLACFFKCNRTAAIGLYAVGILMIGPFFSGMKVNINDVSRYYAGTIMAWVNGIGATAGVLGPWVVGYIVKDSSFAQWMLVFTIMLVIQIVCSIFYCIFTKAERQDWDYPEDA